MKKATAKNRHPNTEPEDLSKNRTLMDFMDKDAFMLFPAKDDWRNKFIYTMMKWAEKEDSVEIVDFTYSMKMRRATLYDWVDKFPDIKEAFNEMKLLLGTRRRKGALFRKYDKDVAFKDMHKFDPEWIEIDKYQASLKNNESGLTGLRVVEIEKFIDASEKK